MLSLKKYSISDKIQIMINQKNNRHIINNKYPHHHKVLILQLDQARK